MSERSLDWVRSMEENPPSSDSDYAQLIAEALEDGDWYSAYMWAQGWVHYGGASAPDPWLGHAASAIVHGQPRQAVRSLDLGLKNWVPHQEDRSILRWARGAVIRTALGDPKTALADFEVAAAHAPSWLDADARDALAECVEAAKQSRKRKPSVSGAPEFTGSDEGIVEPRDNKLEVGERPRLWSAFRATLEQRPQR